VGQIVGQINFHLTHLTQNVTQSDPKIACETFFTFQNS